MKVLSLCFITLSIILKVFALEYEEVITTPDKILSDVLNLDSALNNEMTGELLSFEDINEYWLYTSKNPTEGQRLEYKNEESIKNSNFNESKNTLFVCHGWRGDYQNSLNQNITKAVFDSKDADNWNVICIDWSKKAKLTYDLASAAIRKVGEYAGEFLIWMTTQGLSFLTTVLFGHSLGAHVVGFMGRTSGSEVAVIIGSDTARPLWESHPDKLSKNDGRYVMAIHSSIVYGDYNLIGHADFYPNGGKRMDTCGKDFMCNHDMAPQYWCASWYYPEEFMARQCDSMDDVENDSCCGKEVPFGGYNMSNIQIGTYRFNTKDKEFPFYVERSNNNCTTFER